MKPLVIIHGWSDQATSLKSLSDWIDKNPKIKPITIDLGDWRSMHDQVTLPDVAVALELAWTQKLGQTQPRSVDVIVHSASALVVREWMTRYYYAPETVPIHRLIMLAPANFGSHLAHKGRSFIGRAIKGWDNDEALWQTGAQILKALEFASPYSYVLAERDLFGSDCWYGKGRILCTVLVGDKGYSGVAGLVHEEGSDGIVRFSTANLNVAKITLRLDEQEQVTQFALQELNGKTAFGLLPFENHSSIALKEHPKAADKALKLALIQRALAVTDSDWDEWCVELAAKAQGGQQARLQHTVIRLRDHLGQAVPDYFVELYRTEKPDDKFEEKIYRRFIKKAHEYQDDKSYRSLYLDIGFLNKTLRADIEKANGLYLSFFASPYYVESNAQDKNSRSPVGYVSAAANEVAGLKILPQQLDTIFKPHRTLLIDVQIKRRVDKSVFRLTSLEER